MEVKKCVKVKFSSQSYADFHIKKHKLRNDIQGLEARSYKCLVCPNSWHISSKVDSQKLTEDNCELFYKLEAALKLNKEQEGKIKQLKQVIAQKGRVELKEEIVVECLERILDIKTDQIRDLEARNKALTSTRDYLLCKVNNIENTKNEAT